MVCFIGGVDGMKRHTVTDLEKLNNRNAFIWMHRLEMSDFLHPLLWNHIIVLPSRTWAKPGHSPLVKIRMVKPKWQWRET